MTETSPVFSLESVTKSFGACFVLRQASLSVAAGQCAVILGGSGTGKSVLMRLMLGFLTPDEGRVRVFGQLPPFSPYHGNRRIPQPLGVLFQNDALLEDLSVEGNLLLGAKAFDAALPHDEALGRAQRLLARAGMAWADVAPRKPSELSGGMRKRVALARALACAPRALLIDEPTSGLDVASAAKIIELLREEVRAKNLAAIVITHDLACAQALADRLFLLNPATGDLEEIAPHALDHDAIAARLEAFTEAANAKSARLAPERARQASPLRVFEAIGQISAEFSAALALPSPREWLRRLRQAFLDSLPLVGAIFLLIGMIVFVQTRAALAPVGLYNMLPDALAEAILKLAPPFLGLVMAGRLGSVICAEVGLLRQTEQLDAMRVLGMRPARHLLSPALWAALISFPVLAILAEATAMLGALAMLLVPSQGARIGARQLRLDMLHEFEMPLFMLGLVKVCLFGVVIVLCGYFFGAREQRGAAAIGRSITGAIVASFLLIVALDLLAGFFI